MARLTRPLKIFVALGIKILRFLMTKYVFTENYLKGWCKKTLITYLSKINCLIKAFKCKKILQVSL